MNEFKSGDSVIYTDPASHATKQGVVVKMTERFVWVRMQGNIGVKAVNPKNLKIIESS